MGRTSLLNPGDEYVGSPQCTISFPHGIRVIEFTTLVTGQLAGQEQQLHSLTDLVAGTEEQR